MAMLAFDRPRSKGFETYPDYIFKVFTYHLTLALQLILSKKAQVILASTLVLYTASNMGATTLTTKWQICSPCEPFHTPFQYNQYLWVTLDSVKDLNEICQVFGATDINIMMWRSTCFSLNLVDWQDQNLAGQIHMMHENTICFILYHAKCVLKKISWSTY